MPAPSPVSAAPPAQPSVSSAAAAADARTVADRRLVDDAISAVTTAQSCLDELDGGDGPVRRAQEQLMRALAALERLADDGA
jgi:hypothetical protein